jgi:hypothetical protein
VAKMGRPSGAVGIAKRRLSEMAGKHAEKALSTLVELMDSEAEGVRLGAATALLDRAFGKPAQQVKHSGDEDDNTPIPIQMIERVVIDPEDETED